MAFIEKQANALRLTACCPRALALGLAPGLTLADARARLPELVAVARDHAAEAALLGRLLAGAARYTPMAAAEPPDGLVLDITGCAHAFAGEEALEAEWARRLAALTAPRLALGDTPEMARARARFGIDDLDALPVAALEAGPEIELALRRAGLVTVGDLAARPRGPLAARFGDLPLRLARLLGEVDRRITPARPLPPVHALRRFAEPVARVEDALATLAALVEEAAVTLEQRHVGGRRFTGRFFRSDGALRALTVETARPTRDAAVIARLFAERLDALADPIDPGFGFDLIRLDVAGEERLTTVQPGLDHFDQPSPARAEPVEAPSSSEEKDRPSTGSSRTGKVRPARLSHDCSAGARLETLEALTDRLATRLGPRRLRREGPRDTHVPECASGAVAPADAPAWRPLEEGEPPLRPLQLLDPPQPILVLAEVPDGPPRRFRWDGRDVEVTRAEGPERIAAEWWRRRDMRGLTRDYYRVEDEAGHRFWLFRHGLYGAEKQKPNWFIHGLFA